MQHEQPEAHANLEDLCKSHLVRYVFQFPSQRCIAFISLQRHNCTSTISSISIQVSSQDALLATLAENEKQTELTTRVSTWKQRIEKNLEEQVNNLLLDPSVFDNLPNLSPSA